MNSRSRWLLGLLVSAAALALAVWGIDWQNTFGALQRADFAFLLLALATLVLTLVFRTLRWRVLLGADLSVGRYWSVLNIGYLVNTVLPLRIGDLARAYLISRDQPMSSMQALTSVALERVLDALSVVLMFGLALPFVNVPPVLAQGGVVTALVACGGLAAMLAAALRPATAQRIGDFFIARIFRKSAARWSKRWGSALAGLAPLREPRRLFAAVFWTAAIWVSAIGTIDFGTHAFVPDLSLPVNVFVLSTLGLVVSAPSSPGQVGVYEAGAKFALQVNGVPENTAFAAALTMHIINFIPLVVFGIAALIMEGESLGRLGSETYEWLARTHHTA